MDISEQIQQRVARLPAAQQMQVLDFVEVLLAQAEREAACQQDTDATGLSLALAMRGMEDEELPPYTTSDLKVVF